MRNIELARQLPEQVAVKVSQNPAGRIPIQADRQLSNKRTAIVYCFSLNDKVFVRPVFAQPNGYREL